MDRRVVAGGRAFLLLLFPGILLFLAASCEKSPSRLLGAEPIDAVIVKEESPLSGWMRKGYRGITVIHVDANDALGPVPEGNLKAVPFDGDNYLSAAVRLGIVKEIYWVMPYPFFEEPGGGARARRFLLDSGVARDWDEASGLAMVGGCLKGPLGGTQVTICAPDTMPFIREPVVLDMDVDFFHAFAESRGISALEGFGKFMDAMFARDYRVLEADIRAGGKGSPAELYAGSEVEEVLADPLIMRKEMPPPLWIARDTGESLLSEQKFSEAYGLLKDSIEELGPDRGLRALLGEAALRTGRHDEALTLAGDLCREDTRYCALLVYLGGIANEIGLDEEADAFFRPELREEQVHNRKD